MKYININMYILLTIVLCSLLKVLSYAEVCTLLYSDDEQKEGNIKNPLDRYVNFQIFEKEECSVNTTSIYIVLSSSNEQDGNNIGTINPSDLTIAVKFVFPYKTEIHFMPLNSSLGIVTRKWNIVLILYKCSVAVEEINTFLTFGRIVMLQILENPKIFDMDTKCMYASDLQVLLIQNSCEERKTNFGKFLFWDSCKQTFSRTVILSLKICLNINSTALQKRFPNLYTLVLSNVNIHGAFHFPFNRNYTKDETKDRAIMDVMKLFFDFMQKSYPYYYLFSETSLILLNCQINQSLLYLSGSGDEIRISEMAIETMKPDLFRDIVLSTTIDLSNNNLESVDDDLFQNQPLVKYLYLQNNKLTVLPQNIFIGLRSILTIDVSGNFIKSVHSDPFQSLSNIQEIDLNNNLIEYLPANIFKNQTNSLKVLYLNSNPLKDIPVWPFYATFLSIYHIGDAKLTGQSIIRLLDNLNTLDIAEKEVETQLALPLKSQAPLPIVLLYKNEIETIPSEKVTALQLSKLLTLLSHFTLNFNGNPLTCNCDTYVIHRLYEIANGTGQMQLARLSLNTFQCEHQSELRGRLMWNITENEKYCAVTMKECPQKCDCFKRKSTDTIIVDCRGRSLVKMPQILPPYKLELWFENSNISKVSSFSYFENITVLNLANNHIKQISASVINKLSIARIICLHSNNLTYLPIQIQSLQLTKLTLSNNPFVCDCTMRWMKTWLLNDEDLIVDWIKVQCLEKSNTIRQFIAVSDSHFVCTTTNNFIVGEHVFLPSIIISSVVFVLLVLSLIIYFFRFNVKVLLFVYFNIHPFDKKQQKEKTNFYDTIVIYVQEDKELVEVVINHLRKRGYEIGDLYMHSFVGYTWIENIEKLIACSKSVLLCMPVDSINDKLIQAAWNIAFDKCITSSINSLILVTDKNIQKQKRLDGSLRLFIRSNNCVDRHATLLLEKVDYLVASLTPNKNIGNAEANTEEQCIDIDPKRVLVSYPDELHLFVKNKLMSFLSEKNLTMKVLDMLFTIGIDKREELPDILDAADFVIYIVNDEILNDEISLYILTEILTKSQLEHYNYLLLCTLGQVCIENMPKELSKYVENYVTISANDTKFQDRILESITQIKQRKEKREIHDFEMIPLL
ncbi:protein toll-like [Mercenaria mercenaria]|uniref:protein toll-like n=1 Tax=Mercenaria mercenaria TaxID=6596 RepID=UPI00234F04C8|nr:protein toll-like [Mercenaria mercenaria]